MIYFLEQLIQWLSIGWASFASLALFGWIILIATSGEIFPKGLPKGLIIGVLLTSIMMIGIIVH